MRALVSAAPAYARLARRELDAVLPGGCDLRELAPGTWLLSAPGRLADLARDLAGAVFIRHCCAAEIDLTPPGDLGLESWVQGPLAAALPARLPADLQVQARVLPGGPAWHPGALAAAVRGMLQARGVPVVGHAAEHALSVVVGAEAALAGCSPVRLHLSPWPAGVARLRRDPDEISRAARKLEEALLLFGLSPRPGQRALDLGAAPGGYTARLLRRGLQVTAIDTGALSPRLRGAPGLTFVRGPAHGVPLPAGPFDLLTADLSWDPLRAADCALRFRPRLAPGAHGIVTIKFFGPDVPATIAAARDRLRQGYRVLAIRHLFHDRREATAHLQA